MKRSLLAFALLALPCVAQADPLNVVASDLRAIVDIPFRFGVANLLAGNLLTAQSLASYASPESLQLSIEAVARAIGLDGQSFVGFASTSPGAWIQSTIAIDPNAVIVITPNALYFGAVNVQNNWSEPGQVPVPEPAVLLLLCIGLYLFVLFNPKRVIR